MNLFKLISAIQLEIYSSKIVLKILKTSSYDYLMEPN